MLLLSPATFFITIFNVANCFLNYENQKELKLNEKNKIQLSWKIDWEKDFVHFLVQFDRATNFRWAAVGFSEFGKWPETDFCLLARAPANKWQFLVLKLALKRW